MTTLVSSHNLREMEGICDSVGIIDRGRMMLEKDLGGLRTDIHKVQISFGNPAPFGGAPNGAGGVAAPDGAGGVAAPDDADSAAAPDDADGAAAPRGSATPADAYAKLNVVHMERRGAVDIIIVRETRETLEQWNAEYAPLLFDPIALTMEEIFIYEMGGADHANSAIFE